MYNVLVVFCITDNDIKNKNNIIKTEFSFTDKLRFLARQLPSLTRNSRHIIFASNRQLDVLASSKVWYMDGTFKIVRKPFTQMFSIHAFLRTGDDTKQVPLVFCMRSSRTKKDYRKVIKNSRNQFYYI